MECIKLKLNNTTEWKIILQINCEADLIFDKVDPNSFKLRNKCRNKYKKCYLQRIVKFIWIDIAAFKTLNKKGDGMRLRTYAMYISQFLFYLQHWRHLIMISIEENKSYREWKDYQSFSIILWWWKYNLTTTDSVFIVCKCAGSLRVKLIWYQFCYICFLQRVVTREQCISHCTN
jgi:hypothetical protein